MSPAFADRLEVFKRSLDTGDFADAARAIMALAEEVTTMTEFGIFVQEMLDNLDGVAPVRESADADDFLGAFNTVLTQEMRASDEVFCGIKSDLGRVAWCLFLALSTE